MSRQVIEGDNILTVKNDNTKDTDAFKSIMFTLKGLSVKEAEETLIEALYEIKQSGKII